MSISVKRAEDKSVSAANMLNGQLGMVATGPLEGSYIYHVNTEHKVYWLVVRDKGPCEVHYKPPGWLVYLLPVNSKLIFTATA
jgi:hypothetical protein